MSDAPLSGLKVLDLSRILAGPYCTQMLADLGAEVVKVEPPGGDDTRRFGPPFVADESTYFMSINRGKRSICVDLKAPGGVELVTELAGWADVLVENFRPGVADKLGVGWDAMSSHNPRLVYASISGYGQRGAAPYTTRPGYDLVIQGIGGIASLTGAADGPPHKMGTSVADMVSGLNAYGAIMTALWAREHSGKGRRVDVSMLDGQLSLLSYHASNWLNAGKRPQRLGNAHPSICPYETFETNDGWFNIACGNDTQFEKLCEALERKELATDSRFVTNADRVANRAELLELLVPMLRSQSVDTWLERIGGAGVPCGPIYEVPDALAHPQADARGMLVSMQHPAAGEIQTVGCPLGFEKPTYTAEPPPALGEHGEWVLRERLGWDDERVAEARRSGAVILD